MHLSRGRSWSRHPGRTLTLLVGASLGAASLASAGGGAQSAGAASAAPAAAVSCPWVGSSAPISQRVSQLLAKMTVAQKVTVLTGASGSSYVGFTPAIGSLCIPALNLEDGPAGVGDGMGNVTQLPAPVDVAATWDTSAERLYGQVIGAEQAAAMSLPPGSALGRAPVARRMIHRATGWLARSQPVQPATDMTGEQLLVRFDVIVLPVRVTVPSL